MNGVSVENITIPDTNISTLENNGGCLFTTDRNVTTWIAEQSDSTTTIPPDDEGTSAGEGSEDNGGGGGGGGGGDGGTSWRVGCANTVVDIFWVGDLVCDDNIPGYNTAECNYDNGDCCRQTNERCDLDPQKPCVCVDPQWAPTIVNNVTIDSNVEWEPISVSRWSTSFGSRVEDRLTRVHVTSPSGEGVAIGYTESDSMMTCGSVAFDPVTMYPGYVPPPFECGNRDIVAFPFNANTGSVLQWDENDDALGHSKFGGPGLDEVRGLAWAPEPISRFIAVGQTAMHGSVHSSSLRTEFAPCADGFTCGGSSDALVVSMLGYYNRNQQGVAETGTIKVDKTLRFGGGLYEVAHDIAIGTGMLSDFGFVVGVTDDPTFGSCFQETDEPTLDSDDFFDYGFECGARDIFVAKIDLVNVSVVEVKRFGSPGNETSVGIAIDTNNRLYVAGTSTSLLARQCARGFPSECGGESDIVILMMDALRLERLSVLQFGSPHTDAPSGIALGAGAGQLFVYGHMSGAVSTESAPCKSFTYNDMSSPAASGNHVGDGCGGAFDGIVAKLEVDVTYPLHSMLQIKWLSRWGGSSTDDRVASAYLAKDSGRFFVVGNTVSMWEEEASGEGDDDDDDVVVRNATENGTTPMPMPSLVTASENQTGSWSERGHIGPCLSGWQMHECGNSDIFLTEIDQTDGSVMYSVRFGTSGYETAADVYGGTGGVIIGGSTPLRVRESATSNGTSDDMALWFLEPLQCACGQEPVFRNDPLYGAGTPTPLVRSANEEHDIPELCRFCEEGFFSPDGKKCRPCPHGATCARAIEPPRSGRRIVGSAFPLAKKGYHRFDNYDAVASDHNNHDGDLDAAPSATLQFDFLNLFLETLGDYETCTVAYDVSVGFHECAPPHDMSNVCLAAESGEDGEIGGTCSAGYLTSNVCAKCNRTNGWTRLQSRNMCVRCDAKIKMITLVAVIVLSVLLFASAYFCVRLDTPPRKQTFTSRHALRNMFGNGKGGGRNRKKTSRSSAKVAPETKLNPGQLALLGEVSESASGGRGMNDGIAGP
eukprot:g4457.t1